VNNARPEHQKLAGLEVKTSNLCSEITLPTGIDQHGEQRTAVCCLSSLNLETWFEWKDEAQFIPDVMRFLDNVLQSFIDTAPDTMARARYSAMRERSVGLGVMGYHSFLQALNVPFESVVAKVWNMRMFKHIRAQADIASRLLAEERGPCPDAAEYGFMERFSNKMAIAPTASISIICGGASPGIEPIAANVYNHKTLSGSFIVRNPFLKKVLAKHGRDDEDTWTTVTVNKGSVQHLDFLTEQEKATFLNELTHAYLYKDVLELSGIRHSGKLRDLLRLLAYQIGAEVSYNELGKQLGLDTATVEQVGTSIG
jgi:ribonucleoside-diphosphate reductase alpha chain